ncbi:1-acyl-sn-glycerol-3-phosphate acyltransferase [Acetobacter sp. TBRC 12305]|uniref:1-acyl-sn-glycerol-3-phosphate acyltransferase n=1 Tax=Acetobacter garciniae TaxID=2817435 RepID=A0A939HKL6_9PROT|nr:lysophospholipid acyltransferase family protein [Acetobacter garciniae]MBO1323781.1 1-acyl-sn-glycerol-3-phosphate acyltransferase [Acetobacter garciniae]MBX0343470.1 1-acyl-sn-glycerol-3-phosphate acyltransferase [Acetobacter garciniae]
MVVLRSILFNVVAFVLTGVMGVGAFPIRWFMRAKALAYAKLWSRAVLWLFRTLCGVQVRVTGLENLPASGPALIASQHQSAFDTLVWMLLLPRPCYVMKGELRRIPLLGPMLVLAGMMPIERAAGAKALRLLLHGTDRAIKAGRQIVIFPEGTRTLPGEHVALKPGIAAMSSHVGLPVIPVATNSGLFWGRNAFFKRPGVLQVAIGPAVGPARRADLLGQIEQSWRGLEQRFGVAG